MFHRSPPFRHPLPASAMAIALLFGAGFASAQNAASAPMTSTGGMQTKLARGDVAFLKQAAQNGHAEVEGSKQALTKSTNADVKKFAQTMVDDHTKVGDELTALASSKGVQAPTEPSLAQRGKVKMMDAMSGGTYDRRYAESIGVSAHQDTIKLFRKASTNAKDADVKAFATKTLPSLEHHLEMAQQLKTTVASEGKS